MTMLEFMQEQFNREVESFKRVMECERAIRENEKKFWDIFRGTKEE